jgi:PAS domain S-box-containing protein
VIYITLLLLVVGGAGALAVVAWRHATAPGAIMFAVLMLTVVVWSGAYALELSSFGLPAKLLWTRVEYLGIVVLPAAWVAFVCSYTGHDRWLARWWPLLAIEPAVMLALIWTNGYHGWFWQSIALDAGDALFAWRTVKGPAYWAHAAYTYLAMLAGTLLLVQAALRAPQLYRGQLAGMVLGALVPWVSNGIFLAGLSPIPQLELTPFAFLGTGILVAWSLFRFRLLTIVPIARDRVFDDMPDGVVVLNYDNLIVDINPAACALIRRSQREAIGQPAAQILAEWPDLTERYRDTLEAHQELAIVSESAVRYFDLRISPLHSPVQRLAGRLIVLHEITDRKHAELALAQAKEAAEAASRAKSAFLANVSHELRTPLTAILGLSEALEDGVYGSLAPEQRDVTGRVVRSGRHLLALINDVLDQSQIEAGKLELQLKPLELAPLIDAVAESLSQQVERQGNRLTVHYPSDLGWIRSDAARLRQILFNLLHNANKFTERGRITLTVETEARDNGAPRLIFTVADTGIGMTEPQQRELFAAFTQGDMGLARKYGGTGLGLALTRSLCQLLGGEIAVVSAPGQGATFTVHLPLAEVPAPAGPARAPNINAI